MNNKKGMRNLILVVCIPIILMIVIASVYGNNTTKTYDYSDIIGYFKSEQVEEYSLDYGTGQLVLKLNDKDNTTINYVVANVITFYQKVDPMVEKYNADHTDAPMVEKHIRAREV
ncbi:MAG: hypothetical protein LKK39_02430, partial [Oscillospiraceae bacterium]|nr:hypothetical protein [Oscillospiraceae bacterium]